MKKIILTITLLFAAQFVFAANFSVYKLNNGQTVIIEQIKNNPIVTIDTWIKTGSINEDETNTGISHFLEHLFFKGTKTHPAGDFDKILESKGAVTNAATSKDFTHYYVTITSSYFDLALSLHADMLLHPEIPQEEMDKERKVVLEEISKSANVPETQCYENLVKMMYTTHPYKRRVLGSEKVIQNVTREGILNYYNKYYCPSNMITVIVGDVNPETAIKLVKKNFDIPYKKSAAKKFKKEPLLQQQKRQIFETDISTGYMLIGYRSADIFNDDTYALDVLATILGSGRTSRLYQTIKDEKQLVNSIAAYNATMKDDGLFIIKSTFEPSNLKKVEDAVYCEAEKILKNGVTEKELETAKKIIENTTYYERESVSNIATEMGYLTTLTGNTKYYENYLNNINKVTACDVIRVAKKYLKQTNSAVSVIIPKGTAISAEDNITNISNTKQAFSAAPKLTDSNSTTKKYVYSNGLTLLLNDASYNDIVAISIVSKGGDFLSDKKGTSSLFGSLLLKGTKNYTAKELAQVMEEKGIHIGTSESADSFRINVLTTKAYLKETLDLLNEIIKNSNYDESELNKLKKLSLNQLEQTKDNPFRYALDNFKNIIYGNSVYNNSTDVAKKNIPTITRADVLNYKNKIFNPENIVVAVTGNVENTELFFNNFETMFESTDNSKFDYSKYTIPQITKKQRVEVKLPEQKTAWLILGWQTEGIQNLKDYAALNLINTMLGSGMSSRLFVNLREAEGLAYQLGSSYSPNMLSGSFIVYIGTNPKTLEYSKEKALKEVYKFKQVPVSDKELQEAKDRLLGQYVIALETNSDKASTLCWFEASDRGFKFIDEYLNLINNVTSADIMAVANKYFNEQYVQSVVTTK